MALPYVCIYADYDITLEPFSDAERGRLVMAMLRYVKTGEDTVFEGNERFIWPTLREQIGRDQEAYDKRCAQSRENGKKGGRPRKQKTGDIQPVSSEPGSLSETAPVSEEPEKPNKNENEKENENENKNEKKNKKESKKKNTSPAPARSAPKETGFVPPMLSDVEKYIQEMDFSGLDPGAFLDYYAANGWVQGRDKPIRDWKAALRSWNRNELTKKGAAHEPTIPPAVRGSRADLGTLL